MADFEHFSSFSEDMDIIQKLGDNPNTDDNMSSTELKTEFDKGGNLLKAFVNGMVEHLNELVNMLNNSGGGTIFVGGTMVGPLNINKQKIYGVPEPSINSDAANKSYVDTAVSDAIGTVKKYSDAKHTHATTTLSASGWSSTAPYTLSVLVSGVQATDSPHVSPVYDTDLDTALAQQEAWGMVSKAVAGSGSITFTCFEDKPSVDIPVQVEVNR